MHAIIVDWQPKEKETKPNIGKDHLKQNNLRQTKPNKIIHLHDVRCTSTITSSIFKFRLTKLGIDND